MKISNRISLTFIKGISEMTTRLLKAFGVYVAHKSAKTSIQTYANQRMKWQKRAKQTSSTKEIVPTATNTTSQNRMHSSCSLA
ncbi:unnamed protein product [Schistosoma rodhaini]|nr:unnamed protein product [Schistosoma rodhaini]